MPGQVGGGGQIQRLGEAAEALALAHPGGVGHVAHADGPGVVLVDEAEHGLQAQAALPRRAAALQRRHRPAVEQSPGPAQLGADLQLVALRVLLGGGEGGVERREHRLVGGVVGAEDARIQRGAALDGADVAPPDQPRPGEQHAVEELGVGAAAVASGRGDQLMQHVGVDKVAVALAQQHALLLQIQLHQAPVDDGELEVVVPVPQRAPVGIAGQLALHGGVGEVRALDAHQLPLAGRQWNAVGVQNHAFPPDAVGILPHHVAIIAFLFLIYAVYFHYTSCAAKAQAGGFGGASACAYRIFFKRRAFPVFRTFQGMRAAFCRGGFKLCRNITRLSRDCPFDFRRMCSILPLFPLCMQRASGCAADGLPERAAAA